MHAIFKKSGLSVREIALLVGVSRIAVHNWVAGRTSPHKFIEPRVAAVQLLLIDHVECGDLPLANALDKDARRKAVDKLKIHVRAYL